jgi:hypothetical protein
MSQAITAESLNGATVNASVTYDVQSRRNGQDFRTTSTFAMQYRFGPGGTVNGTVTRTANLPRGPASTTRTFTGTLGKPREISGSGHSVMVLAGNTLTMLRTFDVGGNKTTITFSGGGRTCSVQGIMAREVGAGTTRRDHIKGGTVDIISAKQISSSCQVSR